MQNTLKFLEHTNYSKLKEYLYYFDQNNKDFKNLDFNIIIDLYKFDKKLREKLLFIIEDFEIILKNNMVKILGKNDPFDYLLPKTFYKTFKHAEFLKEVQKAIYNNRKNSLLTTFKKKYPLTKDYPIWIIIEILPMGSISLMYSFMKKHDQIDLAKIFDQNLSIDDLASWIYNLTLLRNFCAHNARVWNRNFKPLPLPQQYRNNIFEKGLSGEIFILYTLIKYIYPNYSFKPLRKELRKFFLKYPNYLKSFGIQDLKELEYLKK